MDDDVDPKTNGHPRSELSPELLEAALDSQDRHRKLCARLIQDAYRDLALSPSCIRRELALAWVTGRHECGCAYEEAGPSFTEACRVTGIDRARARGILLGVAGGPSPGSRYCHAGRSLMTPGLSRAPHE